MEFTTVLELHGKTATGIEVPESVVTALGGGKRPPVLVTINGYAYRSTIAPYGGVHLLPVSAEVRAGAGIAAGDPVTVAVELDTAKREVEVPADLAAALAASHGGVDDTRDLRERAMFAPASSRYKVYIIDEAHMVSNAGFNSLLKLVEEPPPHVRFIFATTEVEKVLGTIRSRTHNYTFRLVPAKTLQQHLARVCEAEGVAAEPAALALVARAGAGSVRDSLSVLGQVISGSGPDGVTYAEAVAQLGMTDDALLDATIDALADHDGATLFTAIDRVIDAGHDPRRFVTDLLERLRDLIVLHNVPNAAELGLIDAPEDRIAREVVQARRFGPSELTRAADVTSTALSDLRGATAPRLHLELMVARLLLPASDTDEAGMRARLDQLERRVSSAPVTGSVLGAAPVSAPPVAPATPTPAAPAASHPSPAAPEGVTAESAAAPAPPKRLSDVAPLSLIHI